MACEVRVSWKEIEEKVINLAEKLMETIDGGGKLYLYGIPRGGKFIAYMLSTYDDALVLVDNPDDADILIDDLIDSGRTRDRYKAIYPDKTFIALYVKTIDLPKDFQNDWFIFPWEDEDTTKDIEEHIVRILEYIGENPNRDGLKDTPARVVKSWKEIYGGYQQKAEDVLKTNFDSDYSGMVVLKDIAFYSMCEHHMLPFFGTVSIAYIPGRTNKVVGISKLARLVQMYSQRLQIQENMTERIADDLYNILEADGVGVIIKAQHLCMKMRGIQNWSSEMVTSSLRGSFKDIESVRNEFLKIIE